MSKKTGSNVPNLKVVNLFSRAAAQTHVLTDDDDEGEGWQVSNNNNIILSPVHKRFES